MDHLSSLSKYVLQFILTLLMSTTEQRIIVCMFFLVAAFSIESFELANFSINFPVIIVSNSN